MVTLKDFIHILKSYTHLLQHSNQNHRKLLLSTFHLNGHNCSATTRTMTTQTKFETFFSN